MSGASGCTATTDAHYPGRGGPPGSNRGREVCIVGGGIGGLTAAIAFARRGARVTVIERAPALREVGAGLQLSPNGAVVLGALGLLPEVEGAGEASRAVTLRSGRTGRHVARVPLHAPAGMPAHRPLHRADLIAILARAAREAGATLRLGLAAHGVRDLPQDAHGRPVLALEGGGLVAPELLVGADGIRSFLRGALGEATEPRFTGQVAWRAVVPGAGAEPAAGGGEGPAIHLFPGRHVVAYPLRGGALVNVVAVAERTEWAQEGWFHPDDPARLRAAFADAAPGLAAILSRVDECALWGLFRHPPAVRFGAGRIALLGDAAHPTLPFLGQGANLAIEDAWALAEETDAALPLAIALERYTARRRPRVLRALDAAEANARDYHLGGPRRVAAHAALGLGGLVAPWALRRRYAWLHGRDVTRERGA